MSHSTLTDEKSSGEEERRLLKAGERLFRSHFPNPDRTGCPGPEVLRAVASRQLSSIPEDFIDHLTQCSTCFVEYDRHLARVRKMSRLRAVAACAGLLALIGIAFWFIPGMLNSIEKNPVAVEAPSHRTERVAVLDLRNASQARGGEQATPVERRLIACPAVPQPSKSTSPSAAKRAGMKLPLPIERQARGPGQWYGGVTQPERDLGDRSRLVGRQPGRIPPRLPPPRVLLALPSRRPCRMTRSRGSRSILPTGLYPTQPTWFTLGYLGSVTDELSRSEMEPRRRVE